MTPNQLKRIFIYSWLYLLTIPQDILNILLNDMGAEAWGITKWITKIIKTGDY